mmetsp:Transcript_25280/g.58921  ORF Transcript_25280/g.58921 Transcript_25280/m.58921 type:complete len:559 (+) Transcript_25280:71-1747(+)
MPPSTLRQGMPHITSHAQLDGIYGLSQPGYSPHPVLRFRQQQRGELHKSASLVLAQSKQIDEWSADRTLPGPLQSLKGAYWPKWSPPAFVDKVPPRIDDCRVQLAAAERELDRYSDMYFGKLQPLQAVSSGSFLNEPAPEPTLSVSGEGTEPAEVSLLEGMSTGTGESGLEEDLPSQLSVLEAQLHELDKKWQGVDEDRQTAREDCAELISYLTASEAYESDLKSQVSELESRLQQVADDSDNLRSELSGSKSEAEALRRHLAGLDARERVLHSQATALCAQLYTSESTVLELHSQVTQASSVHLELLAEEVRAASEALTPQHSSRELQQALQAAEEQERARMVRELAAERAVMEKRGATLEEELAAATLRHGLVEEAAESLRRERAEEARAAAAQERLAFHDRQQAELTPAQRHVLDLPQFVISEPEAERLTEPSAADGVAASMQAAIPQLLFVEDLDDMARVHAGGAGLPAICQVNLASNELRLQPLEPSGSSRKVPLASIAAVSRPPSSQGVVEFELVGGDGQLRLTTADEHSAIALVAAASVPDRVLPGFCLDT